MATDTKEDHPAASVFPLMDGQSFDQFKEDVRLNGQRERIVLFGGKILDGRNRYRACKELGIEPLFQDWRGTDPISYVISANLQRRHLTPSQRAMAAARARGMYDEQAKERKSTGKGQDGSGGRGNKKNLPANLPEGLVGDSRDQVGEVFGVSGKSVDHATKVLAEAIPEVAQAVDEGRMSVSKAATIAEEPEEQQKVQAEKPKPQARASKSSNGDSASDEEPSERKLLGKGVFLAHEAINCLKKIPKNDALRKQGFQMVKEFIKHNP